MNGKTVALVVVGIVAGIVLAIVAVSRWIGPVFSP